MMISGTKLSISLLARPKGYWENPAKKMYLEPGSGNRVRVGSSLSYHIWKFWFPALAYNSRANTLRRPQLTPVGPW